MPPQYSGDECVNVFILKGASDENSAAIDYQPKECFKLVFFATVI